MNHIPYFSILLPTKNRSHLVGFAIRSVLQQDFENFELIVSDNDDNPKATFEVVENFSDRRIKYIRTGGLDMIANWNTALRAATGKHVTVLEDKMIFYPKALTAIKNHIEESSNGLVVWKLDVIDDEGNTSILVQQSLEQDITIKSETVLQLITTDVMGAWSILPRGLCCSVPKSLIDDIEGKTGRPFYEPVSPDFVSAVKILAAVDQYLLAGDVHTMITSNRVSNGKRNSMRKSKDHSYFLGKNKQLDLMLYGVYVKSQWIVVNTVISDYLRKQKEIGGRLDQFNVSNRRYFEMLFRELTIKSWAEKKMLWDVKEVIQLFWGGDGLICNLLYAINKMMSLINKKYIKSSFSAQALTTKTKMNNSGDDHNFIDDYLTGCVDIEDRPSYNR